MRILLAILMCVGISFAGKADPGDHWPWGAEMPFPWKGIQGTWAVYLDGQLTYFAFRTIHSNKGANQLDMIQYDSRCQIIAYGGGFEDEDRIVRGLFLAKKGAQDITIHVFSESALKNANKETPRDRDKEKAEKTYTVMNIGALGSEDVATLQLHKVHTSPYGVCREH
jgi:hypothetical protein